MIRSLRERAVLVFFVTGDFFLNQNTRRGLDVAGFLGFHLDHRGRQFPAGLIDVVEFEVGVFEDDARPVFLDQWRVGVGFE